MAFALRFSETAGREFDTLDRAMQERVRNFLKVAAASTDPTAHFKRLGGNLHRFWKRREGQSACSSMLIVAACAFWYSRLDAATKSMTLTKPN